VSHEDRPFGHLAAPVRVWPRWMSISTAARYLDRTEAAMRGLVARAQIPYVKQGERINLSPADRRSVGIGLVKGVGLLALVATTLALVIWGM
jgi:hypothetical protein